MRWIASPSDAFRTKIQYRSTPVALNLKCGPIIRRIPALLLQHLDLGYSQRGRWRHTVAFHSAVEIGHQIGRSHVAHPPQTGNYASRTRVHEAPRQTNQPLTADLLTQARLATA